MCPDCSFLFHALLADSFEGTCPPPEALQVVEYNANEGIDEPVIKKSVVDAQIPVSWTAPTVANAPVGQVFQNCYMTQGDNYDCSSGDLFPITDTLVDYGDRILAEFIAVTVPVSSKCTFYVRVKGELRSGLK